MTSSLAAAAFAFAAFDHWPWLWTAAARAQMELSKLSPSVRQDLIDSVVWLLSVLYSLSGVLLQIYNYIMALPGTPPEQWTSPSELVTRACCSIILFFAPMEIEDLPPNQLQSKNILYVANCGILSLEALSLTASLYFKAGGRLPRRITDRYHFNIPIWKHVIEYFGAVPNTPDSVAAVIATSRDPILYHVGGRRAVFRNSGSPTEVRDSHAALSRILAYAVASDYSVRAVGTVGTDSMFRQVLAVNISPLSILLKSSTGSSSVADAPEDAVDSFPLVLPQSYETQFATVLKMDAELNVDPRHVSELVSKAVERAKELQLRNAGKRYPLKGFFEWFNRLSASMSASEDASNISTNTNSSTKH